MIPEGVPTVALLICALLSLPAARRDPAARPLAVTLWGLVGASLILIGLHHVLVGPVPFTGWLRAGMRFEIVLRILWRWSVAACLWWTLGSRRGAWICLGIGAAIGIGCAAAYPWLRQERLLGTAYPLIHLGAVIAAMAGAGHRLLVPWRAPRREEAPAIWLAWGLVVDLGAVYWMRDPVRFWGAGRIVGVATYVILAAVVVWSGRKART